MRRSLFGDRIRPAHGVLAAVGIAVAVLVIAALFWWLRNHYAALQLEAERVATTGERGCSASES